MLRDNSRPPLLHHESHSDRARRRQGEAELGVEPVRFAVGHQADMGALRRRGAQVIDQRPHDGLAQSTPLMLGKDGDIDHLKEEAAIADHPGAGAAGGIGAMLLAMGVLAGVIEARRTGQGQVVDVAMTDGAATLMTMMYTLKAMGQWSSERGSNLLDGGAHFYDTYQCRDGKWLSVGAIEPQFYALLLEKTALHDDPAFLAQWDRSQWPTLKAKLAAVLLTRSRDEWCAVFAGSDACVAPVLDMDEAPLHPHNQSRQTFIAVEGVTQPAPVPRFSRTPAAAPTAPRPASQEGAVLSDWGFSAAEIAALVGCGAV